METTVVVLRQGVGWYGLRCGVPAFSAATENWSRGAADTRKKPVKDAS